MTKKWTVDEAITGNTLKYALCGLFIGRYGARLPDGLSGNAPSIPSFYPRASRPPTLSPWKAAQKDPNIIALSFGRCVAKNAALLPVVSLLLVFVTAKRSIIPTHCIWKDKVLQSLLNLETMLHPLEGQHTFCPCGLLSSGSSDVSSEHCQKIEMISSRISVTGKVRRILKYQMVP